MESPLVQSKKVALRGFILTIGVKTMTVHLNQDTSTRLKIIKEEVNRLQMLSANGCKELFTAQDYENLKAQIAETRERIRQIKLKAPIKALIKGNYNCKESVNGFF